MNQKIEEKEILAIVRNVRLFNGLSIDDYRKLAGIFTVNTYQKGDQLIKQGTVGSTFFIIIHGIVTVTRFNNDHNYSTELNQLCNSDFFGEMSLLTSKPCSASVNSVAMTTTLELSKDNFDSLISNNNYMRDVIGNYFNKRNNKLKNQKQQNIINHLSQISIIFGKLDPGEITLLKNKLKWKFIPKGTELIKKDNYLKKMFFVSNGRFESYNERDDKTEYHINEICLNEPIGEESLFYNTKTSCNVRALVDSEVLILERSDFHSLISNNNILYKKFEDLIDKRRAQRYFKKKEGSEPSFHLTKKELNELVSTDDIVKRNYLITDGYYRLGIGLYIMFGEKQIAWPLVGSRASHTAGYSIRKEDRSFKLPVIFGFAHHYFDKIFTFLLTHSFGKYLQDTVEIIAICIGRGNLKIFMEIGPAISDFIHLFKKDINIDENKFNSFIKEFDKDPSESGGQYYLIKAFECWYKAKYEKDLYEQAQLVMTGNIYIALQEQIRVQPDIQEALSGPFRYKTGDQLANFIFKNRFVKFLPFNNLLKKIVIKFESYFWNSIGSITKKLITARMMSLRLINTKLWLGDKLPETFIDLKKIRNFTFPDLIHLQNEYLSKGSKNKGMDWSNFNHRMGFIIPLLIESHLTLKEFIKESDL